VSIVPYDPDDQQNAARAKADQLRFQDAERLQGQMMSKLSELQQERAALEGQLLSSTQKLARRLAQPVPERYSVYGKVMTSAKPTSPATPIAP
jgi:hypothetical protein